MCMSGTDSEFPTECWQGIGFKSYVMMCDAEEAQMFVRALLRGSFLTCQQCKE